MGAIVGILRVAIAFNRLPVRRSWLSDTRSAPLPKNNPSSKQTILPSRTIRDFQVGCFVIGWRSPYLVLKETMPFWGSADFDISLNTDSRLKLDRNV